MTNQLTRKVMENIVGKCSNINRNMEQKVHLRQKDVDLLKNIIYKDRDIQFGVEIDIEKSKTEKHITLDELINSKVKNGKTNREPYESSKSNISDNGIRKIRLDEIVPKVTLASIGKKR